MAGPKNTLDFDLQILRIGDRYVANVLKSPAGQGRTEFGIEFLPEELDELFRGLGRVRKLTRGAASPEVARARDFGRRLFRSVLSGQAGRCLDDSRARAQERDAQLRIRLSLDGVPDLLDLPWELWFDADRNQFIVLDERITLVRDLPVMEPEKPIRIDLPLKVLVAIANPQGTAALDANGEWQRLEKALEPLRSRGALQLERFEHATFDGLMEKLESDKWHVLHFIGHGEYDTQAGEGKLLLENQTGQCAPVGADRLASLLRKHDTLRLVVLNSCEGGRSSRQDAFAGMAQALVQKAIPAVVAMQFPVTDAAAIKFSEAFYKALAEGRPVDQAVSDARSRVRFAGDEGEIEWATPVLYMRGDGRLFDLVAEAKPPPEPPPIKPGSAQVKQGQKTQPVGPGGGGGGGKRPLWTLPLVIAFAGVLLAWGAYWFFKPPTPSPKEPEVAPAPAVPPPAAALPRAASALQAAIADAPKPSKEPEVAPVAAVPAPAAAPPSTAPAPQAAIAVAPKPLYKPYKTGDVFQECDSCPEMIVLPAGSFLMGSPPEERDRKSDEGPQRRVAVASFALGKTEVSFDEWDLCVSKGGCRHKREAFWGRGSMPVINVSWNDAKEYVAWLSTKTRQPYRLPSEAEWEYAARAGNPTPYSWGKDVGMNNANCSGCGSRWDGKQTAPVASFSANAFGLFDMAGNVLEWVEDCWHNDYAGAPDKAWPAWQGGNCDRRVLRGGSWGSGPVHVRSANRSGIDPGDRSNYSGFRVARTLP